MYSEIRAWAELMQNDPTPWELEQIMMIDRIYMGIVAEKQEAEREQR